MKLSRKKAVELCIELWTWCARTGKHKSMWPGWEKYGHEIQAYCWFCEYSMQKVKRDIINRCSYCPLVKTFAIGCYDNNCFYGNWISAKTPKTRKKYAKLFLAQIKKCKYRGGPRHGGAVIKPDANLGLLGKD